ncbi:hypothetical protein FS837_007898 [Tulasnella sp. UAMH 9824]|nr:hypothetical protein FS837_007898 [Tulasnella sp. UAMH 9824]
MSYQANYQPVPYSSSSPSPGRPEHPSSGHMNNPSAKDATTTPTSSSPSLSPMEARHEAENQGSALPFVLFSLAVFTTVIGPAIILLALIFVLNTFERNGLEVRTSADLQNLLTISQLVTTAVSKSVPIVIAIHAYQLAAQWLKSSERQSSGRPSPLQLGLLISVLQGANVIAWLKVRWHLLRGSKGRKRQVIEPSPILTRAVSVLGLLLIVSNAVAGLDTWLHLSSKAISITRMSPYSSSNVPLHGKRLNETQCAENARLDPSSASTCGMAKSIDDSFALSRPEGTQTMTNTSAKNLVVMTDDGTQSIIVPASIEADVAYEATTFGVGTTCMSLTSECLKPVVHDTFIEYGNNFLPYINCSGVYPPANISLSIGTTTDNALPFGVVFPNNGSFGHLQTTDSMVTTNPFSLAAVVNSFAYVYDSGDDYFVNNTGFFRHGRTGAWNVLHCNNTMNEVKYRYIPASNGIGGSYQTISSVVSSVRMASLVSIGSNMPFIKNNMPSRIEGAGLRGGSYTTAFAHELSRELMSFSAALYEPIPVTAIARTSVVLGSKVQLIPLGLYLSFVVIYAFTTMTIGITALIEVHSVKFVKLVHLRITSSLPIIHALFGPVDSSRTWKNDGVEMFSTESEKDRLPEYDHHSLSDNHSASGSAKDAAPTLTSSSPSLSPSEARREAENQGSALTIILFSFAIFTAVVVPALILLALLFAFNTFERNGLEVRTSADLQNLLTISQLVTTVVSKSVSIVIAVHAYQLAAKWLKSSDRRSSGRPSPLQLGLLISLIQGANIIAWFKVRWHLLRGSKVGKRQVIKPSSILTQRKAVAITRMSSYPGSTLPSYGRQLNKTQCEEYARIGLSAAASCGMERSVHDPFAPSLPEGLQTLTNTSANHLAVFTDDGSQSVIVPASTEANVAYEATTLGVGLTSECLKPQIEDMYPQANISLTATSSDALPFGFVYSKDGSFGDIAPIYEKVATNPFSLAAVVNSFAYVNGSVGDYFVNDTGFFTHGRTGAWNVLYCSITVNDVKYRYIPASSGTGGSYQTISSTVSTVRMASLVSIGVDMGVIQKNLPSRIEGAGLRRGSYTTVFAQELSRQLIGLSSHLYKLAPVTAISETTVVLGSRVQLVPLGLCLISVVIYALTTLVIGITALIEAHSVKFVKLVHLRLTSSLPIVHALFGPVDSSRPWKSEGVEMFSTESETDRLYVGPVRSLTQGESFGFSRAGYVG